MIASKAGNDPVRARTTSIGTPTLSEWTTTGVCWDAGQVGDSWREKLHRIEFPLDFASRDGALTSKRRAKAPLVANGK